MKLKILTYAALLFTIHVSAQKNATEFLDLAEKEFNKKNYKASLDIASEAIIKYPDSSKLYDFRGNLYSAFKEYEKAIQDFSLGYKTANSAKLKAHYLMNRGGMKSTIRDFEGAYNDLILAVQFDSTNLDAYSNLSAACDEVRKEEEAFRYSFKI